MVDQIDLEKVVANRADEIVSKLEKIIKWARNEEDLRIEFEKALEPFKNDLGIDLRGHHEFTLGQGRADTLYNLVVIEYKRPGRIEISNDSPGNKEAIDQIKKRLKVLASEQKRSLSRVFGVGTDGIRMIFARSRAGQFEISEPQLITGQIMRLFLSRLGTLGLARKPLISEYLVRDFGGKSEIASKVVQEFVAHLKHLRTDRSKKLYEQWKTLFGEVSGYNPKMQSKKIGAMATRYGLPSKTDAQLFLFAVHSYYSFFMKLLVADFLCYYHKMPSIVTRMTLLQGKELKNQLTSLEKRGGIFAEMGYVNFLEGDLFTWYLDEWDADIEKVLRDIVVLLDSYEPGTIGIDPDETKDILKGLYQYLIDREVRRGLGEYYTPDWLAELVLEEVDDYDGDPDIRILDPACGSGTFLVRTIHKIKNFAEREGLDPKQTLQKILRNVVGFDLNPLAVMAARTNYILALGKELLPYGDRIEIPIYLCDSVLWPETPNQIEKTQRVRTSVGDFFIPALFATKECISQLAEALETAVAEEYSSAEFLNLLYSKVTLGEDERKDSSGPLKNLFVKMKELEKAGINGLWARLIKNAFAPIFIGKFDLVIGNPPWINWERLPESYKADAKDAWSKYGLFVSKGWKGKLGTAKYDVSMIFVYVGIDRYLRPEAKLSFVITQSLFQSQAAAGFRKFIIPSVTEDKVTDFAVKRVHHLVELDPFEDASNRTALMTCIKGIPNRYPVPYIRWSRKTPIHSEYSLSFVKKNTDREELEAWPIEDSNSRSPWLVCSRLEKKAIQSVIGQSPYSANAGSYTEGANGIFWVRSKIRIGQNLVLIENMAEEARFAVPKEEASIETDWLFPLLRGSGVHKWSATHDGYLIFTSKSKRDRLSEGQFKVKWPKTYAYFKRFESELKARIGYQKKMREGGFPFYTMYGSDAMLSEYKVVWREQASAFTAAVVLPINDPVVGKKAVIPDHKLMFVKCLTLEEAHFVCACLNSRVTRFIVKSYAIDTQISTHVLNYVKIPRFKPENQTHRELAKLSMEAHDAVRAGDQKELDRIEKKIDSAVAKLLSITPQQMARIST